MKKLNISASLSNHRELKPGFDSEIFVYFYIVRVMARRWRREIQSRYIWKAGSVGILLMVWLWGTRKGDN